MQHLCTMSTVKRFNLSGFKSTFKRKSNRGGTTRNNVDATAQESQQGFDNESNKTNGIASKNGIESAKAHEIGCNDYQKSGPKTRESKTSRWGFRQKQSGKSKIYENGNEETTTLRDCEPGSTVPLAADRDDAVPTTTGIDADPDSPIICNPPSANGHVVMNDPNMNDNEVGYIGAARWSKTPPRISSAHSFHEVDNSRHHYINDRDSKSSKIEQLETASCAAECGKECVESERNIRHNIPFPVPCETQCDNEVQNMNMKCDVDVNDNAENFEERLDKCLENEVTSMQDDNDCVPSEEVPPAIPPKPATLYTNGQWVLQGSDPVQTKNERNTTTRISLRGEHEPPPRPPARSKTRHGVDVNLPFYKQYLEMKEKLSSQAAPIYEDVRVEIGLENGGLAGELSKLPRQPWYWGPMSQDEAEGKLDDAVDGSFLVRDSSDDRYLLTLSFKSNGRTLHTRIEHRNGLFSLNDSEGHASVIELIENAVKESQGGVFGYMNDSTGIQNFPARLTQWVSRYSEVKSLQYLCRFVIRETYPRHHIRHLPLPKKINAYILENQY